MIDLHLHTDTSDGKLSPEELVEYAVKKGLTAIAITDHDTVDGIQKAADYAKKYSKQNKNKIIIVPGIEISCDEKESGFKEVHIVGLFVDYKNKELIDFTEKIKEQRNSQKKEIIKKLRGFGFEITFEEVARTVKGVFGRPHIARFLVEKYPEEFSSVKDVFDKYLAVNKPAYADRTDRHSIKEAVELIKKAGGTAILAHPGVFKKKDSLQLIKMFRNAGGEGIETYYPYWIICPELKISKEQNNELVKFYQETARKENLLEGGGSDFHGGDRNTLGEIAIPDDVLKKLEERR